MSEHGEDPFDWVGATLDGKYQVDAVVGRGGFGVVYRAHHLGFNENVAVKCLRIPQTLSGAARDEFEQNFLAEGRLLHQLSRATAGIVQALDVGAVVSPNKTWTPFIVLEWLDGQSLEANFAERRSAGLAGRALRHAVELLDPAARALALAHEQGIAHRDIKPANLFLAEVGGRKTLKVLDFGIAKVVSESESFTKAFEETGASLQAFTARYGSPEQFSRRYGATGPWSDVFSLALVLIEAVVGHSALEGSDTAQLFIAAADTSRRPTLRTLGADPGPAIDAVLETALAVDPKERYANAGLFWDALLAALAQSGDVPISSGNASLSGRFQASTNSNDVTRVEGDLSANVSSAALNAGSATELTASTPLPNPSPVPSAKQPGPASRGRFLIAGGVLAIAGALGLWLTRAPSFTPQDVSSGSPGALPSASSAASAPESKPSATLPSASGSSGAPSKTRGFAGLPERDVPAGLVSTNNAWLDKFSVLRRDDNQGMPYAQAFARCADAGKTLCSETQWQHACDSFVEVGEAPSWTESLEDGHVVVRGGGSCAKRVLAIETDHDAQRIGLCCDRAVAMTSASLQKPFLSSTAGVVLRLERALNQRSIENFLDLSEDHVVLNEHTRDKAQLKSLLTQSFTSARDLVIVNDTCDISVAAKKVVTKRTRRSKAKTSYETTGWTAVCTQTRHRDGKAVSAKSTYEFSASSKLRAINDSEAPAATE
ncbi:MAG TPA: serine/threonine-protein kinase [Polyangiaceae bacterium]|nr:serine/threonine-protein kinase [Polyangiaceae bacterium]